MTSFPDNTMAVRPSPSMTREPAGIAGKARARNPAIDFTKGALVVFMVVYHSFNYFHHDKDILKYLRFLPPSFIFIAGYLVSAFYFTRRESNPLKLPARLLGRGLKLAAIFVALNLAAQALFTRNYNQRELGLEFFFDHLGSIFVTGEGRVAVFEVLLPIAYLLLFSGVLLAVAQRRRLLPVMVCLAIVGASWIMSVRGGLVYNLELFSVGVLGILAGFISPLRLDRSLVNVRLLALANLAYAALITFTYPVYALNIVGVILMLSLLYGLGQLTDPRRLCEGAIIHLGKYSLVAYIFQIALLQALFRGFGTFASDLPFANVALAFAITLVLTTGSCELLERWRNRSTKVNRAYEAVFA